MKDTSVVEIFRPTVVTVEGEKEARKGIVPDLSQPWTREAKGFILLPPYRKDSDKIIPQMIEKKIDGVTYAFKNPDYQAKEPATHEWFDDLDLKGDCIQAGLASVGCLFAVAFFLWAVNHYFGGNT